MVDKTLWATLFFMNRVGFIFYHRGGMFEWICPAQGRNAVQTVATEVNKSNTAGGGLILLRAQLCVTSNVQPPTGGEALLRRGQKGAVLKSRRSKKLNIYHMLKSSV